MLRIFQSVLAKFGLLWASALLASVLALPSYAQELDFKTLEWEQKKSKKGVSIFVAAVPNSKFNAVQSHMIGKGNIHEYVALILDPAACPKWADLCKESRITEQVSEVESFIYTYNDLPFPASDRDVLANVKWRVNPATKTVSMHSSATQNILDKTKATRIEEAYAEWYFTQIGDNQVEVTGYAHINPNGNTPAWLTNMLLVSSPYKSLVGMAELINSGTYQDAHFEFIEKAQ